MAIGAPATTAGVALSVSIIALHLLSFLDHAGTRTTALAPPVPLTGALQVLLPLAVMESLFTAVTCIYGHMHRAAGAGAGNRRISELVTFVLCALAGILEFFLFVQPAGGADDGARARAVGVAAVRALPAAATATFFLSVTLIYAHVGNGVGVGGGAVAGHGPPPVPAALLLANITLGAAAGLVSLMAMAFCTKW